MGNHLLRRAEREARGRQEVSTGGCCLGPDRDGYSAWDSNASDDAGHNNDRESSHNGT